MSVSLPQEDNYLTKGLRKKLVQVLHEKGIQDLRVLNAVGRLPRHFFTDSSLCHKVYEDSDFPIPNGRIFGRPFIAARNIELLKLNENNSVLELGTGNGYQACLMAEMNANVYTFEKDRELYGMVSDYFFIKDYPTIIRFIGEGKYGQLTYAPFDRIIISTPVSQVFPKLIEQLKPGGILVANIIEGNSTKQISIEG